MKRILFFPEEKKTKNQYPDDGSDAVGEEIKPVASACGYKVFLHQFGETSIGNADDDSKDDGFSFVG